MTKRPNTDVRRAVCALLARGLITKAEAASVAGVSRQVIHNWCKDIPWRNARLKVVTQLFAKERDRGQPVP